jgi:hypothetical protein
LTDWLQLKCCRKQVSSIGCSSKRAENQLHQLAPAQNVQKTDVINWLQLKTCRKPASSIGSSSKRTEDQLHQLAPAQNVNQKKIYFLLGFNYLALRDHEHSQTGAQLP